MAVDVTSASTFSKYHWWCRHLVMYSAVLMHLICQWCQRNVLPLCCCTHGQQQWNSGIGPYLGVHTRKSDPVSDHLCLFFRYAGIQIGASAVASPGTRFDSGKEGGCNPELSIPPSGRSCFPRDVEKCHLHIQQTLGFLQTKFTYHVECITASVKIMSSGLLATV